MSLKEINLYYLCLNLELCFYLQFNMPRNKYMIQVDMKLESSLLKPTPLSNLIRASKINSFYFFNVLFN